MKALAIITTIISLTQILWADDLLINSLDATGKLTFTPVSEANYYQIQWCPNLTNSWQNSWIETLKPPTSNSTSVDVPMFFRVVGIPDIDAFPSSVPETGQTTSYYSGDDGDIRSGRSWSTPRFIDNSDGTVSDVLTGLEWIKNPHSISDIQFKLTWKTAMTKAQSLEIAEKTGWRLPTLNELNSLLNFGKGSWGTRPSDWFNSSSTPF